MAKNEITQEGLQHVKQQFRIIGNDEALNHAIRIAMQVASTEMTVLITGESGSGKESFSKIIHNLSHHKHGTFIAINCGAIPEGTIDSELFGHEKGAFTGALDVRKGYFEAADSGTLFLDEVSEMPLHTQTRFLRILEYGEFVKVGASKVQKTRVRIIAATNTNLLSAVEQGTFREDLYYRLNTVPIRIPPLRERGNDILLLFHKFASDFASQYATKPLQLTTDAQERLLKYKFPGNIRQLKNLVEQISILEKNSIISQNQLLQYLPAESSSGLPVLYKKHARIANEIFYENEKEMLYKVLFDMKKDVYELKRLVFELLHSSTQGDKMIKEHSLLFDPQDMDKGKLCHTQLIDNQTVTEKKYTYPPLHATIDEDEDEDESEGENLSLEDKEKELIKKALKKYHNNKKQAAEKLGISERTLYRKIKHYDFIYEIPQK